MSKNPNISQVEQDRFPWVAFSWAAEKYGFLLTKEALADILGVGIKEIESIIKLSNPTPVIMSSGKTFRYKFSDIPTIISAFQKEQNKKFTKKY